MTTESALAAMYPSAAPAAPAAPETTPPLAPAPPQAPEAGTAPPSNAHLLYLDQPPTLSGLVQWSEPPAASAAEIKLDISMYDHADTSPAGDAARAKLAEAMVAAGAGPTLAREFFADAARAARPGYQRTTAEACTAQLREQWGARYEAKMAGAMQLVRTAAAVDPQIGDFLRSTGLGNDPAFIRKLAARAAAQARK
ncbi:MAG TPA: hypothetical protein VND19_06460 [Acetobacteraceae bacterium]|nr:hypothetical protein [Acetobacteraceae bacterium]